MVYPDTHTHTDTHTRKLNVASVLMSVFRSKRRFYFAGEAARSLGNPLRFNMVRAGVCLCVCVCV